MAPEERIDGFSADGYWFVDPGKCYAGYLENGGGVWVDLSDVSGEADYFWFNPRDGSITGQGTVSGGGNRYFSAPDSNDWVLVIRSLARPLPEKPTDASAADQTTDVKVTLIR